MDSEMAFKNPLFIPFVEFFLQLNPRFFNFLLNCFLLHKLLVAFIKLPLAPSNNNVNCFSFIFKCKNGRTPVTCLPPSLLNPSVGFP